MEAPDNYICLAASNGDTSWLQHLIRRGESVNSCDNEGNTPLMNAILSERISKKMKGDMVTTLLSYGADVNMTNGNGDTPLHMVIRQVGRNKMSKKCIKRLVNNGAYTDVKNSAGLTPSSVAYQLGLSNIGDVLLFHCHGDRIHTLGTPIRCLLEALIPMSKRAIINDLRAPIHTDNHTRYYETEIEEYKECCYTCKCGIQSKSSQSCDTNGKETILETSPMYSSDYQVIAEERQNDSCSSAKISSWEDDEDYDCPICCEQYEAGQQIFKCLQCQQSLCHKCKLEEIMVYCPFCRKDISECDERDIELENKIKNYKRN